MMAGFDIMGAMSQRNDGPVGGLPSVRQRTGWLCDERGERDTDIGVARACAGPRCPNLCGGDRLREQRRRVSYGSAPFRRPGAEDAMNMALRKAASYGVKRTDLNYVNAHGTSTELNDPGETKAIKRVLGEHAYNVNISSTKSMLWAPVGSGRRDRSDCPASRRLKKV